uniref:uncharacterized protein LOC101295562 isoform X2 n=1 Tax=Fragaria vesca subsp. vesca TaxID=101020 RepID=UPI0005CA0713|nr:PREDICTED: uncharacterized protein LOC101295562 isoform X2 [Fragaria vesca subsp. vesca]
MSQHTHGTNIGILCEDGIVLGNDCRIIASYMKRNTEIHELLSDQEVKIFQICSKPHIFSTLMGDVKEWHKMYAHMLENGFQMKSVRLARSKVIEEKGSAIVIGSGAFLTEGLLQEIVGRYDIMTKKDAVVIALRILMMGSFCDYFTGCKFRVTFLHKGGCISDTYQLLNVYNILYDPKEEQSTMFLIYSTSFGPIFGGENVNALIKDLWSRRRNDIVESNTIAKKSHFYVNRIAFADANAATKAYKELIKHKKCKPFLS